MELSQSLFMLHYFSSFYSLTLYIAVRNEQMGCRTQALWIIPTLQLFVWRANAKLCILQQKKRKKKKQERERKEAAVEEEGSLCQMVQANSTSWLESLTGSHPVWVSSKRWGGGIWLQWNNKCRLQRHFIFSECLLLRQLPIWRWMYHTLFLQSWEIWGRKRTSERAKRTKRKYSVCLEVPVKMKWLTPLNLSKQCRDDYLFLL